LELIASSTGGNTSVSTVIQQLQTKINKLEKYVSLLSNTYFINDTLTGTTVNYDNIDEIVL